MRYNRYRPAGYSTSGYFPPGVKWLLLINVGIFVLMFLAQQLGGYRAPLWLIGLSPEAVLRNFAVWQFVTYLFIHGGAMHLLVNMFTLWMFGRSLETDWGTRQFLKYYFLCGVGAGICDVTVNALLGHWNVLTIGASGAIYGLLLAFGVLYPNQTVLFDFLFPIKAKYFVMIYGALALMGALGSANSGVSNVAHLGGMVFGYAYLKLRFAHVPMPSLGSLRRQYTQWKLQRAKKKFQVYMRKHRSTKDPWVH
jgi:membrane associated rhomboid family serine protease